MGAHLNDSNCGGRFSWGRVFYASLLQWSTQRQIQGTGDIESIGSSLMFFWNVGPRFDGCWSTDEESPPFGHLG